MINVGIFGATGYAGEELIGILLKHPQVKITYIAAKIDRPVPIAEIFPKFGNQLDLICGLPEVKEASDKCELVFLALPHTASIDFVPRLLSAGKKVVDLSADYRLKDIKVYDTFYETAHKDKAHIDEAIYGLPELYREDIKHAQLIANPGCYPTAAILGLAPAIATGCLELDSLIIDAKSGFSGAGRNFAASQINEDFKAYKVNVHQHAPEIDQELSKLAGKKIKVTFVPHLLPLERGILATIYVKKAQKAAKAQNLVSLYKKFYKKEPFVRILEEGSFPQLKDVVRTNFCSIGIKEETDQVIIIAAIDNLLKGASGQAVQNMNIMYNFPEQIGLV
ncbi:N-acetyl-gamma-glutamyl-phosphate reductase [bacterium]|nr:MAG: N-acetyl-gamma-glutamyl-phosphate reductase [bacterium]